MIHYMQNENSILLTAIKDPFNPHSSRVVHRLDYEGKTAQQYINEIYPEIPKDFDIIASIDGSIIDDVPLTIPMPGQNIVFCLHPSGDDAARLIASIAVMIIAIYAPQLWGLAGGAALSTEAGALLSVGVNVAGALIINALMPMSEPDAQQSSASYSWGGTNLTTEGGAWPVIYGTAKILPPIIGAYLTNILPGKQQLNLLLAISDHAVTAIDSIKLNGSTYSNYPNVSVAKRYGTTDQTVIYNFRDTHTQQTSGIHITRTPVIISVPGDANTAIGIGGSFPQGLGYYQRDGALIRAPSFIYIDYSIRTGTDPDTWGAWQLLRSGNFEGNQTKAIKWQYQTGNLTSGTYRIRISGDITTDEANVQWPANRYFLDNYVDYVEGIVKDDFRYPGASLLSITAMATDQLSGGVPSVSCIVTRGDITVYETDGTPHTVASDNPAWVCYDILNNNVYGSGISYTRINYTEFAAWAAFCTTNSYTCNIIYDTTLSIPDALARASILGRGHVVQRGTSFGVIVDKEDDPVQLFGVGNIIENTFKQSYLAKENRVNSIETSYFDSAHDYENRSFELKTTDFDTEEPDENKLSLVLYGATSRTLAGEYARFLLNCNQYLMQTVEFEVQVDALASNVGDVIYVSHDVPQWGYSGHIVSATIDTVTLDREVTQTIGVTYHVLVRHYDDDDLEEVAIVNPETGLPKTVLALTGTWDQIPVKNDVYTFGEITKVAKLFRITRISRTQEMRRKINALEYRAEVYSDSVTIPDYESETALVIFVAGLTANETWKREGGVILSFVSVTWRGFGVNYLYMKEDVADSWEPINSYIGSNSAEVRNVEQGKTYIFSVSTSRAPLGGVEETDYSTTTITIHGYTAPSIIWPVSGLQIYGQGNNTVWQNRDLKLTWNLSTTYFPDEAGGDEFGAGSFPPMSEFGGYRIWIGDSDGTRRRELIQESNEYTYTYERNDEDGTPAANLIIKVWARNKYGAESATPAIISVSNPAPAAPSSLTATPWMKGIKFTWQPNTEIDISYYTYRIKVETDEWSSWVNTVSVEVMRVLTETEQDDHSTEALIYFEVKAVDTFGNESSVSSTSDTTLGLNIQPTDIDDFAITASKIFTKIPVLDGDSWTDDTPDTNSVTWNDHTIYYNGAAYPIAAGSTGLKYIFWLNGDPTYSSSDTNPTLTDGDFIIAVNVNGAHDLAWNAIANQVIGSAYIENLAVLNEHVSDLSANKINVGTLQGIDIVGNMIRTSSDPTKKAIIITSEGIALYVPATTGKWGTFKWGDGTQYGTGFLAFIHHSSSLVPFTIQSEQIVADFHLYNRGSDPTGVAAIGDFAFSEGKPKFCTGAGTPGTWKSVIEINQQAHEADAVTSHTIADTGETVDRSDIEDKLNAIGTKINNILSKLESGEHFATS